MSRCAISTDGCEHRLIVSVLRATRVIAMQRSTDRFLTTHTGSLPRPAELVRAMYAKEEGVPVDADALDALVASAVADVVRRQAQAGIDIVDDGEMSKPSYATYIKDRLSGFGGAGNTFVYGDLADFPNLAQRVFGDPGRSRRKTPACDAAIGVRDRAGGAGRRRASAGRAGGGDAQRKRFSPRRRPASSSLFFRNEHYPSDEAYLHAIAEAMRDEYETIAGAGIVLQIDCPDLGMGRHIQYADLTPRGIPEKAELHVEALNHALRNIAPERLRMHLCWGNYEGPHHCDVPLADVIDIVFRARPAAIAFEAANPRHAHEWKLFETVKLPDGQDPHPRRDRIQVEFHRAPGADRAADRAATPTWSAARTSWRAATAATAPGLARRPSIRTSCGRNSPRWPKARGSRRRSTGPDEPKDQREVAQSHWWGGRSVSTPARRRAQVAEHQLELDVLVDDVAAVHARRRR